MNKKLITGIHHINLKANGEEGLKKAVHFYRDVLGLSEVVIGTGMRRPIC